MKDKVGENLEGVGKAATDMISFFSGIVSSSVSPDDLGITYVTERVLAMGFPSPVKSHLGCPLDNVSNYLNSKHKGNYMVFNLSEKTYDISKFDQQVMEFKFPGYPSPPLGTLLSILKSMHSWLSGSPNNVVVVHCYTGKGRTALIIASYLLWIGRVKTAKLAISYVSDRRRITVSKLVIPSQLRYLNYFAATIKGEKLNQKPLRIGSIKTNSLPTTLAPDAKSLTLEIFENGSLISRSECALEDKEGKKPDSLSFEIEKNVEGDILVRAMAKTTERKFSIFRFNFHTGYHTTGLLTLQKHEVDLASTSTNFQPDFKVDILFEKAVTNYGKPAKGRLKASYWEGIAKISDPPPALPDHKENPTPRSPLDASEKKTSSLEEKDKEKETRKEEKSTSVPDSKTVDAKDKCSDNTESPVLVQKESMTVTIKVPQGENKKLAELVNDLDADEDDGDEVDEETTKALLEQIEQDGDEDDDDVSFEMIKDIKDLKETDKVDVDVPMDVQVDAATK
uniref:Phosphatidylinositol-3,4,5-trisphosphate 3-phosphatase n=1 Tax=Amorphochlora amoebiformis TaxID=1561963 RepID=A0A7S0H9R3_9EUKA